MLETVEAAPGLIGRHTQNKAGVYVFIQSFNIGIGMVQYVVLYLPVERIAAKYIQNAAQHIIHCFVLCISAL